MDYDTKNAGAGASTARDTTDQNTQNVLSRSPDPSHTEAVSPGAFGPFRYWVNNAIRNGASITLLHGDEQCTVTELTMEGQLRLAKADGSFALVPLDERYIPDVFEKLI